MKQPKLIILDFDRTLIDLYKNKELLKNLAKKICDYYIDFTTVDPSLYNIDGYHSWYKLHRIICQKFDYNTALKINNGAEQLVAAFENETVKKTNFFEGTFETLKLLFKNKIELMIVSSNCAEVIKNTLKEKDVLSYFSNIYGRPIPFNPDNIKPSPAPILQAIKNTSAKKDEIWYVGDDVVDVDSAKACGIVSIGVATGKYSASTLKERGADYVLENFNKIICLF